MSGAFVVHVHRNKAVAQIVLRIAQATVEGPYKKYRRVERKTVLSILRGDSEMKMLLKMVRLIDGIQPADKWGEGIAWR